MMPHNNLVRPSVALAGSILLHRRHELVDLCISVVGQLQTRRAGIDGRHVDGQCGHDGDDDTGRCAYPQRDIHPDVIVADIMLPGISGLELARRLRDDARTKDTAIIVLTGRTFGGDEEQATAAAGCDRFLLKPCLPDDLAFEIRHVLSARGPAV